MAFTNSSARYGTVARSLHWLTALLIFTAFPLGMIANTLPFDTSEALARKGQLFSVHKTLGLLVFFVALARILWALTQPRPAPLHPGRRLETLAAELVHWSLYVALVAVPLSGWIHHAAVEGFAPILWPFGQDLPFVPKSEAVAGIAGAAHWLFTKLLLVSVALHVAGALKHVIFDRDDTLARMTHGRVTAEPAAAAHPRVPALAAVLVWLAATGLAYAVARPDPAETAAAPAAATAGNWQVESGSLGFSVRQMGAAVSGSFPNWTAEITFDEAPVDGKNGSVTVTIDTTTMTLGSVTAQAKEAEFFDVAAHPTAVFRADILPEGTGYAAQGTLSLRGTEKPVSLPFTLILEGDTARMTGKTTLDRRDFGMGASYGDESSVGFPVTVTVALTAKRAP